MNRCYISYCLETGSGGIQLNYKKDKVTKYISLLLNEASRPGAVFDSDGKLLYVNNSFCKEFCIEETGNIQEFIENQSMNLLDEIKSRITGSDYKTFDMPFQLAHGRERVVKVHLMYFDEEQQILALFAILRSTYTIAEKVYEHAFRNSDNCMIVVDKKGIIYDINDKHTEFFNLPKDYFVGKPGEILAKLFLDDSATYLNHMNEVKKYGYAESTRRYERSFNDVRYYWIDHYAFRSSPIRYSFGKVPIFGNSRILDCWLGRSEIASAYVGA